MTDISRISKGKQLGSGGEGSVYEINNSDNCIKEFNNKNANYLDEKRKKIEFMIKNPPTIKNPMIKICWPIETVFDKNSFVGYIMPKAFNGSIQLDYLINITFPPSIRNTIWVSKYDGNTPIGEKSRLNLMNNLAFSIHQIHSTNKYCFIDLKPKNILVTEAAAVSLIDLDSIQIMDKNGTILFKAEVLTPEYAPPEWHNNPTITRTIQWDYFSFAVIAYQILFTIHPFNAVFEKPYENVTTPEEAIKNGLFVYGRKSGRVIKKLPIHNKFIKFINSFPKMKDLFHNALDNSLYPINRPTIADWGTKIYSIVTTLKQIKKEWIVVGGSVIGKSHIEKKIPCQDSNYYEMIDDNWGIAIVSDGAGSQINSKESSNFVVNEAFKLFKDTINKYKWISNSELPTNEEWKKTAEEKLKELQKKLEIFAKEKGYEFNSLSATVIVVIFSHLGILTTHIGDGRAGYCNKDNKWKSLITPLKGEYANTKAFITSNLEKGYVQSHVLKEEIKAFTLLSDGSETACYKLLKLDETIGKYFDRNEPNKDFFNDVIEQIKELKKNKYTDSQIKKEWEIFLEAGTNILKDEQDDKTIIIGFINE